MKIFDDDVVDDDDDTDIYRVNSQHAPDIRKVAVECIDHFFCDKTYWAGGNIPKSKLLSEDNIKIVMSMPIMDALAIAYFCLEKEVPEGIDPAVKGWEIKLCVDCIRQCHKRFIPKVHVGGMLLMYLYICHGINYIPILKKLEIIRAEIEKREKEAELKLLIKQQAKDDR